MYHGKVVRVLLMLKSQWKGLCACFIGGEGLPYLVLFPLLTLPLGDLGPLELLS